MDLFTIALFANAARTFTLIDTGQGGVTAELIAPDGTTTSLPFLCRRVQHMQVA